MVENQSSRSDPQPCQVFLALHELEPRGPTPLVQKIGALDSARQPLLCYEWESCCRSRIYVILQLLCCGVCPPCCVALLQVGCIKYRLQVSEGDGERQRPLKRRREEGEDMRFRVGNVYLNLLPGERRSPKHICWNDLVPKGLTQTATDSPDNPPNPSPGQTVNLPSSRVYSPIDLMSGCVKTLLR